MHQTSIYPSQQLPALYHIYWMLLQLQNIWHHQLSFTGKYFEHEMPLGNPSLTRGTSVVDNQLHHT